MSKMANETVGGIPIIYNWEFATAAARAVATDPYTGIAYKTSDIGKIAKQTDDNSLWSLTAVTPTWKEILTAGNTAITDVATLADAKIWVGNGSAVPTAVTPSGDIAMTNAGAVTVTDLTIANEAQGDILYRGASSWVRLAKDEGKYLKSGASAVSWDTPAGGGGIQSIGIKVRGNLYASTSAYIDWVEVPKACTIANVRISVATAPTGATLIVDVHYHASALASATTIFTTGPGTERPVIADGGLSDVSGTPDVTSLAQGGYLSFFIDQVGSTVPGADLCIQVVMA